MYNKEYYLKLKAEHPEKIKEYSKKAYQRGKEKFLENSKELYYKYKVEKPEALKEYAKKSYEKLKETNPEKLKEQHRLASKRFYEKNKDRLKQKRQDRIEMLKNLETLAKINEKLEDVARDEEIEHLRRCEEDERDREFAFLQSLDEIQGFEYED